MKQLKLLSTLFLAALPLTLFSQPTLPRDVGELGDPSRLIFDGVKTYAPQAIKNGLVGNSDFLLASHPAASFAKYLEAVRQLVSAGYKSAGFRDVNDALREITNEDLDTLLAVLPTDFGASIRNTVELLRESKGKPIQTTLAAALDRYWEQSLRKAVQATLMEILRKPSRQTADNATR